MLADATEYLAEHGIDQPRKEARLLFELAYGQDTAWQMIHPDEPISDPMPFFGFVQRRGKGEPMAYLRGSKGFWSLDLEVTRDTLIPRGDTETLMEALIRHRPDRSTVSSVLDLGTGSGCLLLAALAEYPAARGIGIDRVESTARQAAKNARLNHLEERALFCVAQWAAPLAARFDVVISNPPYIPQADIGGLMKDVADYEPMMALDGGADGLAAYRDILPCLPNLLTPDGLAILEFGIGQGDDLKELARVAGLQVVELCADLGGITRAIVLSRE
ncbi:peptide chain release factor N(5)-glutamine methyltransferase [Acetobacter sp. LMG 1627]|uniref:Peptide chain release factor N(5)-glutamine methyltransferase n=2 Tax=Acetobacter conturbans TaxID=1737472 RepID=A0ABX0JZW0_9PROT|nr:peptide chain release factor N(5)-glutamine methyltransferase [Acetobacter conturbans]